MYRARGHRQLAAKAYEEECTTRIRGCHMPVGVTMRQRNPSNRRYRTATFCHGPRSCSFYRAGPARKVPGRPGMSYTEEDWVTRKRLHISSPTNEMLQHRPLGGGIKNEVRHRDRIFAKHSHLEYHPAGTSAYTVSNTSLRNSSRILPALKSNSSMPDKHANVRCHLDSYRTLSAWFRYSALGGATQPNRATRSVYRGQAE